MALGLRLRHKVKLQKAPTVFVASPGAPHIKRYLAGGGVNQPVGLCAVCKQRAALSQWKKKIMKKIEAETKAEPEQVKPDETKSDEAAGKATTCGHRLTCHPGCSNPDGRHNHSAWWPRAMRRRGLSRPRAGLEFEGDTSGEPQGQANREFW